MKDEPSFYTEEPIVSQAEIKATADKLGELNKYTNELALGAQSTNEMRAIGTFIEYRTSRLFSQGRNGISISQYYSNAGENKVPAALQAELSDATHRVTPLIDAVEAYRTANSAEPLIAIAQSTIEDIRDQENYQKVIKRASALTKASEALEPNDPDREILLELLAEEQNKIWRENQDIEIIGEAINALNKPKEVPNNRRTPE
jgi:hypothetical protein